MSRLLASALIAVVLGVSARSVSAASGTWTNLAGGSWTNNANWGGGVIATGNGNTANFSTLTLGTAPMVTLDGAQTIGNLSFGDVGNTYGWTLNTGSAGPLTLAVSSGSPVITVSNQATTIGLVLAGTAGLIKQGAGTLVLTNANTYTGTTLVSNGVVTYSGSGAYGGGSGANLEVGGAWGKGVFNLNSTGTVSFTSGTPYIGGTGVSTDTGAGAINQTAGTMNLAGAASDYLTFGAGSSTTYGSYNFSGGTLNISSPAGIRIGFGGLGSYVQTGGTLNCQRYFVVGANNTATGSVNDGVASFLGGSATISSSYYIIVGNLNPSYGVLNLGTEAGGAATITSGDTTGPLIGQVSGATGTLNLNSGTLTISGPIATASSGIGTVNLNGGTIQAGANNTTLINTTPTSVNVYNGGITVNDPTAVTNTISARLLATAGDGIYPSDGSFVISSGGGSGYLGAPLVVITNVSGIGANAMAIASIAGGVVTGVTMTCPGQNYNAGDVVNFFFSGGGASTPATTFTHTLQAGDLAPNMAGGLTKLGAGLLTLTAASTYSGGTLVNAGTLNVTTDGGLGLGNVTVANGAALTLGGGITNGYLNSSASLMVNTGALVSLNYSGTNTIHALSINGGNTFVSPGVYGSAASGALNNLANFTGTGVLNVLSATSLSVTLSSSANPSTLQQAVTFTGTVTGNSILPTGTLTFLDGTNLLTTVTLDGSGTAAFTTNFVVPGSHFITAAYSGNGSYPPLTSAILTQVVNGGTFLWTGAVSGAWDINASANWAVLGNPVNYQDGSSVQFDDSASGTTAVTLNTVVSPSSLVFSNNLKPYSFSGSGALAGAAGLTKLGAGTVTLSTSNTYTGTTLVSNGIVAYRGGGAYSGGGTLSVGGATGVGVFDMNSTGTVSFTSGTPYLGGTGVATDTGAGAINQTAGTMNLVAAGDNYLAFGAGSSTAYGSYNLSGGALNISSSAGIRIGYGGLGSYVQSGGTMNCPRYFVVGANNSAAGSVNNGVASFLGGSATVSGSYYIIIGNLKPSFGVLNLGAEAGGTAAITSSDITGPQVGQVSGATGVLNLNSGTLTISGPIATASGATGIVNLDGGTIQSGANSTALIDSTPTSVNVYNGGVTINEPSALTNTISASLLATAGNGIYPSGGSFVIASRAASPALANHQRAYRFQIFAEAITVFPQWQ